MRYVIEYKQTPGAQRAEGELIVNGQVAAYKWRELPVPNSCGWHNYAEGRGDDRVLSLAIYNATNLRDAHEIVGGTEAAVRVARHLSDRGNGGAEVELVGVELHDVAVDRAGHGEHLRLTCYTCAGATLIRQPHMSGATWQGKRDEFDRAHPHIHARRA